LWGWGKFLTEKRKGGGRSLYKLHNLTQHNVASSEVLGLEKKNQARRRGPERRKGTLKDRAPPGKMGRKIHIRPTTTKGEAKDALKRLSEQNSSLKPE